MMTLKALTISDKVIPFIYSATVRKRFAEVDLVISCGDLPYYYLEYIISMLNKPLFFVRGNHASVVEYGSHGARTEPWGAIDLHRTVINHEGLLMAGFEGSMRYNKGPFQYTDSQMYAYIAQLLPRLFLNRALYGRYLDVLVTHAPPRDIHDQPDRCHRGFAAFRWFLKHIRPRYMLHGHIHLYHPNTITQSTFHQTEVINCYGYREVELLIPDYGRRSALKRYRETNDNDKDGPHPLDPPLPTFAEAEGEDLLKTPPSASAKVGRGGLGG